MLNLMDKALQSDTSLRDKITYFTSVTFLQSIRANENQIQTVVEHIKNLLASESCRVHGLLLLREAVKQNPEICFKGQWHVVLQKILKEPESYFLKMEACDTSTAILSQIAKDPTGSLELVQKYLSFLIPVILEKISNSEWVFAAVKCLATCVKSFPFECKPYKEAILMFILENMDSVSSTTFEFLAECFSELPNCARITDPIVYQEAWTCQYLTTLNTMHQILNNFLTFASEESSKITELEGYDCYALDNVSTDVFSGYMQLVRHFINFSKCLAKMLSTKTRCVVQVPIKETLACISRLFQVPDMAKLTAGSLENKILMSTFCQMQIAALVILEPLILNFNLLTYSYFFCHLQYSALQAASSMSNITTEDISPIRHVVWKLFGIWLGVHTAKASFEICRQRAILDELLRDISIEETPFQEDQFGKNAAVNPEKKNGFTNSTKEAVCNEALKVLERLVYSGATFLPKKVTDEILSKVVYIAYAIHPSHEPPFPYTSDSCRKRLYKLLLALTVVSKPDHCDSILAASAIFNNALRDSSIEVTSASLKAAAVCRLFLHPKKPPPLLKDPEDKKKSDISSAMVKFTEWASEDNYVPSMPPVESISNASENVSPRVAQAFHHSAEKEMHSSDFMEVDVHYSEQAAEGQCNGLDILEVQVSSQCQEEESEEEDEEEDEEEEEDDRSFCEEEMNQDMATEHMYISNTSELAVMTPVHITPETAHQGGAEQELPELKPCENTVAANVVDDDSNKNIQLNGVPAVVPDEELPSASAQNVANENGIYNSEGEEMDEEDEEEEVSYPAEKKTPEFYDTSPKKPKLEIDEKNNEVEAEDVEQPSRSPTLLEMKADFVLPEVDDVKS